MFGFATRAATRKTATTSARTGTTASRGRASVKAGTRHQASQGGNRNFIKKAIKKPGQLHRDLNIPEGQRIPAAKLQEATRQPGKVGMRARLAQRLKGFNHSARGNARAGMRVMKGSS